jgi:hypothetical protein
LHRSLDHLFKEQAARLKTDVAQEILGRLTVSKAGELGELRIDDDLLLDDLAVDLAVNPAVTLTATRLRRGYLSTVRAMAATPAPLATLRLKSAQL